MKKYWMTTGRERDLIKYCEKGELKDSKPYSFEEAKALLIKKTPSYELNGYAERFLKGVAENPFNDWTQY